ncbi:hypothetical protein PsorP6_017445 [Peronosclerospora sorghi]|uniref:Uncharacterized protein n=1 Tax=Peronosclerospora sorghi TaxID=230839 RepID=A0ACC0WL46_9STRA|nr:hypothetical protein PsorP6_017445 [Peronosclerospora sorghi]
MSSKQPRVRYSTDWWRKEESRQLLGDATTGLRLIYTPSPTVLQSLHLKTLRALFTRRSHVLHHGRLFVLSQRLETESNVYETCASTRKITDLLTKWSRPPLRPSVHTTNPGVLLVLQHALRKWLDKRGQIRYF